MHDLLYSMTSPSSAANMLAAVSTGNVAPSLMIPFAFPNINEARVKRVIEQEMKIGTIERIDKITMKCDRAGPNYGKNIFRYFVHFAKWSDEWAAEAVKFESNKDHTLKIVYDDPWFWMVRRCEKRDKRPVVAPPRDNVAKLTSQVDKLKLECSRLQDELDTMKQVAMDLGNIGSYGKDDRIKVVNRGSGVIRNFAVDPSDMTGLMSKIQDWAADRGSPVASLDTASSSSSETDHLKIDVTIAEK